MRVWWGWGRDGAGVGQGQGRSGVGVAWGGTVVGRSWVSSFVIPFL